LIAKKMSSNIDDMTKDELAEALGDAFRASQNRTQAFDDLAAEQLGVNLTDLRCIDVVERLGHPTAGEVARAAGLSSGAMTAALDRLERVGYVRRTADERDRRVVRVELTDLARERANEIYGPMAETWGRHVRRYTAEELRFLLRFLRESEAHGGRLVEDLRRRAR